jgi:hypothetical protein
MNSLIPDEIKERCYEKFNNIPNFHIPDICGKDIPKFIWEMNILKLKMKYSLLFGFLCNIIIESYCLCSFITISFF